MGKRETRRGEFGDRTLKKWRTCAACILVGMAGALVLALWESGQAKLSEEGTLQRTEWNEEGYAVVLEGTSGEESATVTYEVNSRRLTDEEVTALFEEARALLPDAIRGGNESLHAVTDDLSLVTSLSGYPFALSWKSMSASRIDSRGIVNTANLPAEGEEIVLIATFTYEDVVFTEEVLVRLLPRQLTAIEQYEQSVEELLAENDLLYEQQKEVVLPGSINGETLSWREVRQSHAWLCIFGGIAGAILIPVLRRRKEREREQQEDEALRRAYPQFVTKLQLYLGAGLTVRNAFLRMGEDYGAVYGQKSLPEMGARLLAQKLSGAAAALQNGMPESTVYQRFGRSCREKEYRRLAFLLSTNVRQGNERILQLLAEETENALQRQRDVARTYGEEAGVKLLFPMLLMLLVVMVLILLPAMRNF